MKARVDFAKVLMPKATRALQPTSNYVNSSGLDHRLLELVKIRTSQLNDDRGLAPFTGSRVLGSAFPISLGYCDQRVRPLVLCDANCAPRVPLGVLKSGQCDINR